jgi:carbon storage regulator CsrA
VPFSPEITTRRQSSSLNERGPLYSAADLVVLRHHLTALRLPTVQAECQAVARQGASENLDYLGFLLRLCEQELADRERRACVGRLKAACFLQMKSLDEFDFTAQPSLKRALLVELSRCEFIDRRESVILLGGPGTGKTHVAIGLASAACQRVKKVRFFRLTELLTKLLEAREERVLGRLRGQLACLDLLLLDEFGYVAANQVVAELLFEVMSTSYERRSVMVTTNLPFDRWTEALCKERQVAATLDRLTYSCHLLEATGESYRLKEARRRRKASEKGGVGEERNCRCNKEQITGRCCRRPQSSDTLNRALHFLVVTALHFSIGIHSVVSRKPNKVIYIGDDIQITVIAAGKQTVRLGITAPKEVPVHRHELSVLIFSGAGRLQTLVQLLPP